MKAQFSIRIETDIWERFQTLFPRQASPMIEEYLNDVIGSDTHEGLSREEIKQKILLANKNKNLIEREERVLQQELASYDKETEKKKELLESDEAKSRKELYFEVPQKIRGVFAEICNQLEELKIKEFGTPIIPFDFYYKIDDIMISRMFQLCDENLYFEFKAILYKFIQLREVKE